VPSAGVAVPSTGGELSWAQRREAAQALLEEHKLAMAVGKVVEVEEVAASVAAMISSSRTKLLGLVVRVAQRLPHLSREDLAVIDGLQREALEDLADEAEQAEA
jgi:hypothetical protein